MYSNQKTQRKTLFLVIPVKIAINIGC